MSEMLNKLLGPYVIIPDTNVLRAKDKYKLTSPSFDAFWDEYTKDFLFELKVPKVVMGEILYQQFKQGVSSLKTISAKFKEINEITGKNYSYRVTESKVRKALESEFGRWLARKRGRLLPTPVTQIDWKDVVDRSVWRRPPFEYDPKHQEKGFRDAMILETLRDYLQQHEEEQTIAFICKDVLLKETATDELKEYLHLSVYEDLEDFESYLKLARKHLEEAFIKSIIKKATRKFFKRKDERCLYYREGIRKKIKEQFKNYFDELSLSVEESPNPLVRALSSGSSENWSPVDLDKFWISNAQFVDSDENETYHWTNIINFVRQYRKNTSDTIEISVLASQTKILRLTFQVNWSAKVSKTARFTNLQVIDAKMVENLFYAPSEEEHNRWKLNEI